MTQFRYYTHLLLFVAAFVGLPGLAQQRFSLHLDFDSLGQLSSLQYPDMMTQAENQERELN